MNRARFFNVGLNDMRQFSLSNISLGFHTGPAPAELGKTARRLANEVALIPTADSNEMQDSFGHLYGYGAAYYTYQWSKVISDDLFTRFEKEGLRNTKTAAAYRREVLEAGGSRPAAQSIRAFLERDWSLDAYKAVVEKDR